MATTQKNAAKTNGKKATKSEGAKDIAAVRKIEQSKLSPKKRAKKAAQKSETTERSFGRDKETVKELLATAKAEKHFPNPYRPTSSYATCVDAICKLGLGKWHDAEAVVAAYKSVADKTAFKSFKSREARNENGLDNVNDKIVQNCNVICRTKDYGLPLVAVGYEARRQRTDDKTLQFGIFRK